MALTGVVVGPVSWTHHWSWVVIVPVLALFAPNPDPVVRRSVMALLVVVVAEPYWWSAPGWVHDLSGNLLVWTGAWLLGVMALRGRRRVPSRGAALSAASPPTGAHRNQAAAATATPMTTASTTTPAPAPDNDDPGGTSAKHAQVVTTTSTARARRPATARKGAHPREVPGPHGRAEQCGGEQAPAHRARCAPTVGAAHQHEHGAERHHQRQRPGAAHQGALVGAEAQRGAEVVGGQTHGGGGVEPRHHGAGTGDVPQPSPIRAWRGGR